MTEQPPLRPMSLPALGLMRLSTAEDRDDAGSLAVIEAALEAGVRLFDTAPSYAHGEADLHHNECLLGRAIRSSSVPRSDIHVVTKAGLTRVGTKWVPDGRASSIRSSALASLAALDVGPIDLLLLHCIDPRVALETSVRALDALRREGVARAIGLSEVGRDAFLRATELAPIAALELRVGAFDDRALRTGLVELAHSHGALVLGHTPLGGAERIARIERDPQLRGLAAHHSSTPGTLVLAWLLRCGVVPLPGATRRATALLAASVPELANRLDASTLDAIASAVGARPRFTALPAAPMREGEIVLVMGIQGAGKSHWVGKLSDHERLNRDLAGGSLKKLHAELDRRLAQGASRFVLDNTYATRAARADVIDLARRHGIAVRCLFLDTPLHEAQVNVIGRMLARHGELLAGDALKAAAKRDPGVFLPNTQHRYLRELERPSLDEGFCAIEQVPFVREPDPSTRPGRVVALELATAGRVPVSDLPTLAIAWAPHDTTLQAPPGMTLAVCAHGAGPATCWCRPPLPGLIVRWMLAERIDPSRSTFIGNSRAHRTMAEAFGMRWQGSVP